MGARVKLEDPLLWQAPRPVSGSGSGLASGSGSRPTPGSGSGLAPGSGLVHGQEVKDLAGCGTGSGAHLAKATAELEPYQPGRLPQRSPMAIPKGLVSQRLRSLLLPQEQAVAPPAAAAPHGLLQPPQPRDSADAVPFSDGMLPGWVVGRLPGSLLQRLDMDPAAAQDQEERALVGRLGCLSQQAPPGPAGAEGQAACGLAERLAAASAEERERLESAGGGAVRQRVGLVGVEEAWRQG